MNRVVKQITNNLMLKGIACMLGFLCWLKYSHDQAVHCWIKMPLSFYNVANQEIDAPEQLAVQIRGNRTHLYMLDAEQCAIHLDAEGLKEGSHALHVTPHNICLPESITMVNYSPSPISVEIK